MKYLSVYLIMIVLMTATLITFVPGCDDDDDDDTTDTTDDDDITDDDDDDMTDDDDDDASDDDDDNDASDDDDDDASNDDDDDDASDDDDDDDTVISSPAVDFNGTSDWGQVPYDSAFDLQVLTVECWFNLNQALASHTDFYPLVSKEERTKSQTVITGYGWRLFVANINGNTTLGFIVYDDTGGYTTAQGTTVIQTGTWHHAAATYDGSNLKVYLDGVQDGSVAFTATIGYNSHSVGIGWPCWSGNCHFLNGKIDEVRISDVVRYTGTFTPEFEFSTVTLSTIGLWHFNEGSGTSFFDTGPHGNNGTLTSSSVWTTRQ